MLWMGCLCAALVAGCGSDSTGNGPLPRANAEQIDAAVATAIAQGNLPGVVLGVWIPGRGDHVTAQGLADIPAGLKRESDHPFRIASITKTFIATATLRLVDAGRLRLTDTLATWYPAFPNAQLITIDHLLRMRSGIPDSADADFLAEYYANPLIALDAEAMIARAAARRGEFVPPGGATRYTNVNFMLLERIVEKASGSDIRSVLARQVFEPLGMRHTVYPAGTEFDSPLHGYSFEPASGLLVDRTLMNPVPAGGAGALVSTLQDLHTYARALCRGDLLMPATQRVRLQATPFEGAPEWLGYGQGVVRFGRFCGHNGTIFGFSSELWYLPKADAVIVINVNRLDADDQSRSTALFEAVAKQLFPDMVDW
jgi:D-alanyl-D-alanine carboxypeptidase